MYMLYAWSQSLLAWDLFISWGTVHLGECFWCQWILLLLLLLLRMISEATVRVETYTGGSIVAWYHRCWCWLLNIKHFNDWFLPKWMLVTWAYWVPFMNKNVDKLTFTNAAAIEAQTSHAANEQEWKNRAERNTLLIESNQRSAIVCLNARN